MILIKYLFQGLPYPPWMVVGHLGRDLPPVLSPVGQGQYSDSAPVLTQHHKMEERRAREWLSKDKSVMKDHVQVFTVRLCHLSCEIMWFWMTFNQKNFLFDKIKVKHFYWINSLRFGKQTQPMYILTRRIC